MTLSDPPSPFPPFNTGLLPAGAVLVRFHAPEFAGEEPNPCKGGRTRFAPIHDPGGACVPTLYAAQSLESAAFESVFHDVPHTAEDKFVPLQRVTSRVVSWLELRVDLKLANLFEPDLNRLRLTRTDLIDTPASAYDRTARWAEAFHSADPGVAGLAWTSRRCDTAAAYMLFGDRLPSGALMARDRVVVGSSAELLSQIRAFGERAGIILTI